MTQIKYIETDAYNAFTNFISLIDNAKKYISISTWIFTQNDVSEIIMDHLLKKIEDGIIVTIVHYQNLTVDIVTSPIFQKFVALSNGKQWDLDGFGIKNIEFPSNEFVNYVTHEKLTCVDDQFTLLSDRNISNNYYCYDQNKIDDLTFTGIDVLVEDPNLCHYVNNHITSGLNQNFDITEIFQNNNVNFYVKHPIKNIDNIKPNYFSCINAAQKSIIIVNVAFSPTDDIIGALNSATERGVKVSIITNKVDHMNDIISASATINIAIKNCKLIKDSELYGFTDDKLTLHHKYMIVDDKEIVFGSYNFDYYSEEKDVEYLCRTKDVNIITEFKNHTNNLLKTKCDSIELNSTGLPYYFYNKCFCSCCL